MTVGCYFLGRIGDRWLGEEHLDGTWQADVNSFVTGENGFSRVRGGTREELLTRIVLQFQQRHPRPA